MNFKQLLGAIALSLTCLYTNAQNGLHFDGTNDYVSTTYAGITGTANRTFEAWIKPSSLGNMCIIDYGVNQVGSRNTFKTNANGGISFISGGTNANIGSSANAITANVWSHVAFVLNNGVGYLYVNGVQVGTGNLSTVNTPTGNANITLGERVSGGSIRFQGVMDEVRVWNVARTAAQISATMNTSLCSAPSSLKAYYTFNHGTASGTNTGVTTLTDFAGTNNGTLHNFSLSGSTSNWVTGASITAGSSGSGTATYSGCVPFTSGSGNQVWNTSGTYTDTVTSAGGCDSILTVTFTALQPSSTLVTATACNSYTSQLGNSYTATGIYTEVVANTAGCDSTITLDLTINQNTFAAANISGCSFVTLPSGTIVSQNGTYVDTISNAIGCDSIIAITVTIQGALNTSVSVNDCDSYTAPSGAVYTQSGTYVDTLTSVNGCDSIVELNLTLGQSQSTTLTEQSCGEFTSAGGNTYSTTGTYTENYTTASGCDSIVTINLTVNAVDNSVTVNDPMLTANLTSGTYQWLSCPDMTIIDGATNATFEPTDNGSYAVIVNDGTCADTSDCYDIAKVAINEINANQLAIYPNPSQGILNISADVKLAKIELFDLQGRQVAMLNSNQTQFDLNYLAKGTYLIHIKDVNNNIYSKLIDLL